MCILCVCKAQSVESEGKKKIRCLDVLFYLYLSVTVFIFSFIVHFCLLIVSMGWENYKEVLSRSGDRGIVLVVLAVVVMVVVVANFYR